MVFHAHRGGDLAHPRPGTLPSYHPPPRPPPYFAPLPPRPGSRRGLYLLRLYLLWQEALDDFPPEAIVGSPSVWRAFKLCAPPSLPSPNSNPNPDPNSNSDPDPDPDPN
eukprot:scaffold70593_cov48-Phaeocystis_antarctica.AAC.2